MEQQLFKQIAAIKLPKMDKIIKGEDSYIDELIEQIGHLNLDNLVNIKADVKEELPENPNVNDMPSTSYSTPRYATPRYNSQTFDRPDRGYAGLQVITKIYK